LDEENVETLEIAFQLLKAYWRVGETEIALAMAYKALPVFKKVYGGSHSDTVDLVKFIADTLFEQKKFVEAVEIISELNVDELEPSDRAKITTVCGKVCLILGLFPKAQAYLSESLNYLEGCFEEICIPEYTNTAQLLAECLEYDSNGYERAYQSLQSSVNWLEKVICKSRLLVPTNAYFPFVSHLKFAIANNRRRVGNYDEFFKIVDQLIESANEFDGTNSRTALKAECRKALCLAHELKLYAEAVDIFERILPFCRLKFRNESDFAIIAEREVLRGKYFMGSQEALTELKTLCFTLESKLGKGHPELHNSRLVLAECLRHDNQDDEALKILNDILEEKNAKSPDFLSTDILVVEKQIAEIKFSRGDKDNLLQFFEKQMNWYKDFGIKTTHPDFLDFITSLNDLPDIDGEPVYTYLLSQTETKHN